MNADSVTRIRIAVFGIAGLVCASYSVMAFITNTPNPFTPWLPGVAGFTAGLVMWVSAFLAGRKNAGIAHDELYQQEWSLAVRFSYWFAIALYPLFGLFLAMGWISPIASFAAMGTATGAAPMLVFCVINLRS